jgi:hypothetical protein
MIYDDSWGRGVAPMIFHLSIQMQARCQFLDSGFAISARPGMTLIGTYRLATSVMAGLVPAIHVFAMAMRESRMGA